MMKPEDFVSSKVKDMPFSGIRKFFDVANEIEGVISLGVGEPDFDTPWSVRERAIYTLEKGKTVYTSNAGLMELRTGVSDYLFDRLGVRYIPKTELIITVGASEAIDLAFRATLNPGDEVIVPEPSFVCYKNIVELADGIPVVLDTKAENNFKITAEELVLSVIFSTSSSAVILKIISKLQLKNLLKRLQIRQRLLYFLILITLQGL